MVIRNYLDYLQLQNQYGVKITTIDTLVGVKPQTKYSWKNKELRPIYQILATCLSTDKDIYEKAIMEGGINTYTDLMAFRKDLSKQGTPRKQFNLLMGIEKDQTLHTWKQKGVRVTYLNLANILKHYPELVIQSVNSLKMGEKVDVKG